MRSAVSGKPAKVNKVPAPAHNPRMYYLTEIRRNYQVWNPATVKAQYNKLSKQANKRLETMAKYELGRESNTYKMNVGRFVPASELTLGEMKVLLADAAYMLTSETGSMAGIRRHRKRVIQSLHDNGFTFVNGKNLNEFLEFMEEWRAGGEHSVGSPTAAELYNIWTRNREMTMSALIDKFDEYAERERGNVTPEALRGYGERINSEEFRGEFAEWLGEEKKTTSFAGKTSRKKSSRKRE